MIGRLFRGSRRLGFRPVRWRGTALSTSGDWQNREANEREAKTIHPCSLLKSFAMSLGAFAGIGKAGIGGTDEKLAMGDGRYAGAELTGRVRVSNGHYGPLSSSKLLII